MAERKTTKKLEIVEPIGARVLIRKDEDRKQTKTGKSLKKLPSTILKRFNPFRRR